MSKTAERMEEVELLKLSNFEMRMELLKRDVAEIEKQYKELVDNISKKYCEDDETMSLKPDGSIVRQKKE
jgi:hypothetical protein